MGPAPPLAEDASGPLDFLLVMKPPEAAFVSGALSRCAPSAKLARAGSEEELYPALSKLAPSARLIGFSTAVIVPADVLAAFDGNAYNFHPGPPNYPGNRPSAFACYDAAGEFGVTLHYMTAKVDAGAIVDCIRFATGERRTASALAVTAYQNLAKLFVRNAIALSQTQRPLRPNGETWGARKTTLAMFEAMRAVPGDIDPDELDRRIRAFNWVYTPLPD